MSSDCHANPPRRTRRRSLDADGRSAPKYHDPCRGEPSSGQRAREHQRLYPGTKQAQYTLGA